MPGFYLEFSEKIKSFSLNSELNRNKKRKNMQTTTAMLHPQKWWDLVDRIFESKLTDYLVLITEYRNLLDHCFYNQLDNNDSCE